MGEIFAGVEFTGGYSNHILGLKHARLVLRKGIVLSVQPGHHHSEREKKEKVAYASRLVYAEEDQVDSAALSRPQVSRKL